MSHDPESYTERVFVPGDDSADRAKVLRAQAGHALAEGDDDRAMALLADAKALEATESVAAHWEERATDITRGQHFRALDADLQRQHMASWRPVVWRDADGEIGVKMDAFLAEHTWNKRAGH